MFITLKLLSLYLIFHIIVIYNKYFDQPQLTTCIFLKYGNGGMFIMNMGVRPCVGEEAPVQYNSVSELLEEIIVQIETFHTKDSFSLHWNKQSMLTI